MKKIHKLKKWYSLAEAASRLTDTLSEPVSISDLLELAISENINLYWFMRSQPAVEVELASENLPSLLDPDKTIECTGYFHVKGQKNVSKLQGPFKLLLEENSVLADYFRFALYSFDEDDDKFNSINGYYVSDKLGRIWNLLESYEHSRPKDAEESFKDTVSRIRNNDRLENYFPSGRKPKNSELGFTNDSLDEIELELGDKGNNEIKSRERDTLYKLIIGMAKDGYGYDYKAKRSPLPKELEGVLDRLGIPVSDDTIRSKLKKAAELLDDEEES